MYHQMAVEGPHCMNTQVFLPQVVITTNTNTSVLKCILRFIIFIYIVLRIQTGNWCACLIVVFQSGPSVILFMRTWQLPLDKTWLCCEGDMKSLFIYEVFVHLEGGDFDSTWESLSVASIPDKRCAAYSITRYFLRVHVPANIVRSELLHCYLEQLTQTSFTKCSFLWVHSLRTDMFSWEHETTDNKPAVDFDDPLIYLILCAILWLVCTRSWMQKYFKTVIVIQKCQTMNM